MFLTTGVMNGHDPSPVKEKHDEHTIETERAAAPAVGPQQPKAKRTRSTRGKATKKNGRAKKTHAMQKADRANKKAEVIAMLKRAKGATPVRFSTTRRVPIEDSGSNGD